LLILPLFLIVLSFLIEWKSLKKNRKTIILLFFLAGLSLIINFSRAYFLGILVGLILLVCGLNWRRGLVFYLTVVSILVIEFIFLFVIVNGGEALRGLNFFGSRLSSVADPESELSSLSRMNILPKLIEKIKQEPIFGQGLGQTVSYFDPITNQEKQTFHLDWGYLEIWVETGLFGLLSYLMMLAYVFKKGFEKIKILNQDKFKKRLIVGLLSGLLALMVATITGPFLFHPLGIFYVILTILIIANIDQYDAKSNNSNCHVE
jgi:O-antigen ligase